MTSAHGTPDICLILEGTYPYVTGGVSAWTHELIGKQDHLTFHIISLLPRDEEPAMRYSLPANVVGFDTIHLQRLPHGAPLPADKAQALFATLREPLVNLTTGQANLEDFERILNAVMPYRETIGSGAMLDSEAAFDLITAMYGFSFAESSFLDYFWSWRAILGGLYSLISATLPEAKAYHAMSTGYAGIMAARAKLETGKPVILTEHGIYTNERRIEIASADWLEETASKTLTIDRTRLDLRDLWIDTFTNYSRICYQACDHIITLYSGNQSAQMADGADGRRMRIIPNGIDIERYGAIAQRAHDRPTVALIGRVVPIKDVKSFIRAAAMLRDRIADLRVLIMGSIDEDPDYAEECRSMVEYLALGSTIAFTGNVVIDDYLPEIDVVVFSSISEAQPLVILEAGACGIPAVATDVGACGEMILGKSSETPALGAGGIVTPLANPGALAEGIFTLLSNREFYAACSNAMRTRVMRYYNKHDQYLAYRELYAQCMPQASHQNKNSGG